MTKKINSVNDLQLSILELEQKRNVLERELKQQLSDFSESIKPVNIIKNTFQDAFGSENSKKNIIGAAIGLGSALLSGRFLAGRSNLLRKSISAAAQFGLAGIIAKNAEKIKSAGAGIIYKIFRRRKRKQMNIQKVYPLGNAK